MSPFRLVYAMALVVLRSLPCVVWSKSVVAGFDGDNLIGMKSGEA
jgi:hypothetical protein